MKISQITTLISLVIPLLAAGGWVYSIQAGQQKNTLEIKIIKKTKECDDAETNLIRYESEKDKSNHAMQQYNKWNRAWSSCIDELKALKSQQ